MPKPSRVERLDRVFVTADEDSVPATPATPAAFSFPKPPSAEVMCTSLQLDGVETSSIAAVVDYLRSGVQPEATEELKRLVEYLQIGGLQFGPPEVSFCSDRIEALCAWSRGPPAGSPTDSAVHDSFSAGAAGVLETPPYTKPPVWRDLAVPEVLMSGHHGRIAAWRAERGRELTRERRRDLLGPATDDGAGSSPTA